MKRWRVLFVALTLVAALVVAVFAHKSRIAPPLHAYLPPKDAQVSYFPARTPGGSRRLVIAAATDVSFMERFIEQFQRHAPDVTVLYVDSLSTDMLREASRSCERGERTPDLYLTASTDHLVKLANDGCALPLPHDVALAGPAGAQWRGEVAAFTVEPAVIVTGSAFPRGTPVPDSHLALIEWLRSATDRRLQIGVYDIESSGTGYNFTVADSRQAAIYGRLLESIGRMPVRSFCCSNLMVEAIDRGEIALAYNVQMSYAYAAQRKGALISVILPRDYQALQTRSVMIPRGAHAPEAAREFARFLVSAEGRDLARSQLLNPRLSTAAATRIADRLLEQASVTPLLLALHDRARRTRTIEDWKQAIQSRSAVIPVNRSTTPLNPRQSELLKAP